MGSVSACPECGCGVDTGSARLRWVRAARVHSVQPHQSLHRVPGRSNASQSVGGRSRGDELPVPAHTPARCVTGATGAAARAAERAAQQAERDAAIVAQPVARVVEHDRSI